MRVLRSALVAFFICVASTAIWAEERILSFHSDIDIQADGAMLVTETLRVTAKGDRIKRGIYREFPTTYKDRYGNRYRVGFDVLEVRRDGIDEPWHQSTRSNGERVYIGDRSTYLTPGDYTFSIRYRTTRQIGFFANQDELYWNVTGNGWDFTIDAASAEIRLPQPIAASSMRITGYTGAAGSRAQNVSTALSSGVGRIDTSVVLAPREGLTVVLSWPKGVVEEPSELQRLSYLLHDNLSVILALLCFLGSAAYLLVMWHRYGKDPAAGVVFPHYEPPAGYSPASLRYVHKMVYDNVAFSAAIINLAVKGYLSITCEGDDYTLHRKPSSQTLAPGEQALLDALFVGGDRLLLDAGNHAVIGTARRAHSRSLSDDYRNIYFKTNLRLMLPTLGISMAMFIITLILLKPVPLAIGLFAAVCVLNGLFAWLMRAPSLRGRRLMDKSAGFKLYLEVAEKDDLNLRNPPELTPALFEAYLPYAVALGVEQPWAERFSEVFARLEQTDQNHYSPSWYRGSFHHSNMSGFTRAVGSGLSSAVSSAAAAPGSSSGRGGFSGGGGGGGGGGGW